MGEDKKIDWTKPVQTRDGRKVRVLCTDRVCVFPVIALLMGEDGEEAIETYTAKGLAFTGDEVAQDLVNVPEEVVKYINVYSNGGLGGGGYETAEEATNSRSPQLGKGGMIKLTMVDGKPTSVSLV